MLEKVKEIIADTLNIDPEDLNENTSFKEDLDADSLDLLEAVMAIEDEFGIEEINTEELAGISTVGDMIAFMTSKGFEI